MILWLNKIIKIKNNVIKYNRRNKYIYIRSLIWNMKKKENEKMEMEMLRKTEKTTTKT